MLAILAHDHATLAACFARFFGGEFMGGALGVGGATSLAGDHFLFVRIHRGKSSPTRIAHGLFLSVVGPEYDTFSHSDRKKRRLVATACPSADERLSLQIPC